MPTPLGDKLRGRVWPRLPAAAGSLPVQGQTQGTDPDHRKTILVVNPNSSLLMTEGIRALSASLPSRDIAPGQADAVEYIFYTAAPERVPESIDNEEQEVLSANECLHDLTRTGEGQALLARCAGVLVACFSNHPLARMLSQAGYPGQTYTILQTAVMAAVSRCGGEIAGAGPDADEVGAGGGHRQPKSDTTATNLPGQESRASGVPFATITTTPDLVADIDAGVQAVLDNLRSSDQYILPYVGTGATGVRAIELKTLPGDMVRARIESTAKELLLRGARTLILGCSGTFFFSIFFYSLFIVSSSILLMFRLVFASVSDF